MLVTNSFSGPDRMDNLLKYHRCPILDEVKGGIPLLMSPSSIRGPALKRFALLLCSRLPSARSAIHPFRNSPQTCHPERSRGIGGFFSVPVTVLRCPILDEVKGGIPLLKIPSSIRGPALKRFARLLCSRLPSARSAIHPFRNSPQTCHPERSRGICGFFSVPVTVLGCPILDEVKGGIPLLMSPSLSVPHHGCWGKARQTAGKRAEATSEAL